MTIYRSPSIPITDYHLWDGVTACLPVKYCSEGYRIPSVTNSPPYSFPNIHFCQRTVRFLILLLSASRAMHILLLIRHRTSALPRVLTFQHVLFSSPCCSLTQEHHIKTEYTRRLRFLSCATPNSKMKWTGWSLSHPDCSPEQSSHQSSRHVLSTFTASLIHDAPAPMIDFNWWHAT